ncbi:hypothetical protein ACIA8K_12765 [Catenuloplanes sp. NPDC051500]|uniref:hypothetical protein n=1 Tax=Catenuloplanes sp. NPDC051500 TaxID=3363959 RepID=UPI0037B5006D
MSNETLAALIARIERWDDAATAELERLGDKAEETCDYRERDMRAADHGETAWELLGALVDAVKKTL